MKNFGRALLLLTLGLVLMSQVAMAQDALSPVLPAPESTRLGSQLIYVFEDGNNLGARGAFKTFLTIVNTNITSGTWVHFQFYIFSASAGCTEAFDYWDYLTQAKRLIIDPANVRKANGQLVGVATDGRYIMTATTINNTIQPPNAPNFPGDLRAYSFNWLSGQLWVSQFAPGAGKTATYMTNAVAREGVDALGGPTPDGTLLDGGSTALQLFRPGLCLVNSFFRTAGPGAVQPGVPFGNRLTVLAWGDQYTNAQNMYRIFPVTVGLNAFVFDDNEAGYSVPPRSATCLAEWTIAPDVVGATGNFTDFVGAALSSAVNNTGGWLLCAFPITRAATTFTT